MHMVAALAPTEGGQLFIFFKKKKQTKTKQNSDENSGVQVTKVVFQLKTTCQ
jgi:hypothetical protein